MRRNPATGRRTSRGVVLLRAAAWGTGVAIGVAGGGWLTVVSGSGAPGALSLGIADFLWLPVASAAVAFVLVVVVQLLFFAIKARVVGSNGAHSD
ncbi:MAG: hypothetical protein HGA39_07115 [Coriobacteriia bacterium]|nr:hypothetical protein [Coriobacteriia bacterium]